MRARQIAKMAINSLFALKTVFNDVSWKKASNDLSKAINELDINAVNEAIKDGADLNKGLFLFSFDNTQSPRFQASYSLTKPLTRAIRNAPSKEDIEKDPQNVEKLKASLEVIESLLQNGANPNEADTSEPPFIFINRTPIYIAARFQTKEIADLLKKYGANIDFPLSSHELYTPLAYEASKAHPNDDFSTLRALVDWGADVNAIIGGKEKDTPLHLTITSVKQNLNSFGNGEYYLSSAKRKIEILLQAGANPLAKNGDDQTPLEFFNETMAFAREHVRILENNNTFNKIAREIKGTLKDAESAWEQREAAWEQRKTKYKIDIPYSPL